MGIGCEIASLKDWHVDQIEIHHIRTKDRKVVGLSLSVQFLGELEVRSKAFAQYLKWLPMPENHHQYLKILDVFFNEEGVPDPFIALGLGFNRDESVYLILAMALTTGRYKLEIRANQMILVISELPYVNLPGGAESPVGLFDNITPEGVLVSLPNHMCPSEMDDKGPLQVNIDLTDDYLADQFSDLVKSSSVIGGDEIAIIQKALVAMGLDNDFNGDNAQVLARVVKTALELNLFQLVEIEQGGHVFRLCFHCLTTFGLSQVDRYGVCV